MRFLVHHAVTGEILRQGTVSDPTEDDPAPHLLQARAEHEVAIAIPKGLYIDDTLHAIDVATGGRIDKPTPHPDAVDAERLRGLRHRRNALLAASDWTQLPSTVTSGRLTTDQAAAWELYRQALADLPSKPAETPWPTPPT